MSQRFYDPTLDKHSTFCKLDAIQSGHLCKVLRKSVGDRVEFTNGKGDLFSATVSLAHPKKSEVSLSYLRSEDRTENQITIAMALPKSMDRFEWFIEKATEIGIARIIPLTSRFSERKNLNKERAERILDSAFKQSLRLYRPILDELTPVQTLFEKGEAWDQKFIGHCYLGDKTDLIDLCDSKKSKLMLIGPEGDFSEEEISKALDLGYKEVSLGSSRLRTETAGLMALARMILKE
jgi:16S rRNA (uracil1498-N3)-methyltransferase